MQMTTFLFDLCAEVIDFSIVIENLSGDL